MSALVKRQEFAVRFGSGVTRQTVHIGKMLKAVRGIELLGYVAAGLDGVPVTYQIRFDEIQSPQLKSWATPGYSFPLCRQNGANAVATGHMVMMFDTPRLVSNQGVTTLEQLTCTISTATGAAPSYTELTMWFNILYEDDRMDLLPETVTDRFNGMLNFNEPLPRRMEERIAIDVAQRAAFSRLRQGK